MNISEPDVQALAQQGYDSRIDCTELARLARADSLTGLLNRASFVEDIARHLATMGDDSELALLYIDLDRFKPVNDTLGHPVGDQVLVEVARRIRDAVRPADLVARLGGDEFALLQTGAAQPAGSRSLAKRIIDATSRPFTIDGHTIHIGVSIGVAIAPFDADNAADLLRNADLALYQAKEDGKGVMRYFEPKMNERLQARRQLEVELRAAISDREFQMCYQPVMDVGSSQIIGVEALVRWQHPERGLVAPGDFIPLAEETGLIVPIGEWVLRQACQDAARWQREVCVAVNVSAVQLRDRDFVNTVLEALANAGLPPARLELEITETSLMAGTELTLAILTELRGAGVSVALDDFGTGYSSINYLRRFRFDKIKIDRSFVTGADKNSDSAALVRMIAALGVSLAVATTAEGVETAEEFATVREAGCSQIQGYLLSRPVPQEEIAALLT